MTPASIQTPDPARVREDRAIFRALKILERRARGDSEAFTRPSMAAALFRLSLADEEREHFEVAFLCNRHKLIARERLFSGTIDGAQVAPRIVAQRALYWNAAACVVAHNHPSDVPEPSASDRNITKRLADALALVEVRLLDHIIVSRGGYVSLAECGCV